MLQEVRVRNPLRPSLEALVLPLRGASKFPIVFIDGLLPVKAEFVSIPYANIPGEHLQSSRVGPRNIILTLELKPQHWEGEDAEDLRDLLSDYFVPEAEVNFEIVTSKRTRLISGTVEGFTAPLFSENPEVQISVLCHDPYFRNPEDVGLPPLTARVLNGAPWEVVNTGKVPTGMLLSIVPEYDADSLSFTVAPKNDRFFMVDTPIQQYNDVVIDSRDFQKDARNADTGVSYLDKMGHGSRWQQLYPGENQITVTGGGVGAGFYNNLSVTFERRYVGL